MPDKLDTVSETMTSSAVLELGHCLESFAARTWQNDCQFTTSIAEREALERDCN
jgi:hypothetical protein